MAFETLRCNLFDAPVLAYPSFSPDAETFILDKNASQLLVIGAVLSQMHPDGTERVRAYGSCRKCDIVMFSIRGNPHDGHDKITWWIHNGPMWWTNNTWCVLTLQRQRLWDKATWLLFLVTVKWSKIVGIISFSRAGIWVFVLIFTVVIPWMNTTKTTAPQGWKCWQPWFTWITSAITF